MKSLPVISLSAHTNREGQKLLSRKFYIRKQGLLTSVTSSRSPSPAEPSFMMSLLCAMALPVLPGNRCLLLSGGSHLPDTLHSHI